MIRDLFRDAEDVIFYPTYGFQQGTDWIIPVRAKVQQPRGIAEAFTTFLGHLSNRDAGDPSTFMSRLADFLADDESNEDLRVQFDQDPDQREYRIANESGEFPGTDANGIVEGTFTLPDAVARRLLAAQGSASGWLTYHAVSREHPGTGRVRLLDATGVSVVSDIDDTIKITEIPAGARIFVTNTFYRDFAPTTELTDRFSALKDASFHYVSGGPWQLYRPVSTFLIGGGHFPEGTFHMKSLTGSIRTLVRTVEDLARFVLPDGTFEHKVAQISRLMERFPKRTFIFIGDSGEKDPEVYREVQSRFGARVKEVVIRDLTNARTREPARLAGMTIAEAPTVEPGVSQFGR